MLFHPLAALFPMMEPTEFKALVEDIKQNGQLHPIVIWEDQILDGRNRFRACEHLNIEPKYTTFEGSDPFAFVVSLNLHRRHLSSSQRAAIALSFEEHFAKEAAKIQRTGKKADLTQKIEQGKNERTAAHRSAKLLRTNRTYVSTAKKIRNCNPRLFQEMLDGKISIHKAIKETMRELEREIPLPKGTYEIILADPPWQFEGPSPLEISAHRNYPTMSDKDLLQWSEQTKDISAPSSVLFLWTVSLKLPLALKMMEIAGFEYRSVITWHKTRSNNPQGAWLSMCSEFLLIGSKGRIKPAIKPPSVIQADRLRHSEKPAIFHDIIEEMFPTQNKIEMFARKSRKGWTAWGNEAEKRFFKKRSV